MEWFELKDPDQVDSPALLVYPDRIRQNIAAAVDLVSSPGDLRPHVKTSKIAEVCQLMMDTSISKFKCATIAEAEMLGLIKAPDVLLAYQPTGPKIERFLQLISTFPTTQFSCLVDNAIGARAVSARAAEHDLIVPVFIDVNTGMDRCGVIPARAFELYECIVSLPSLKFAGLHAYDGQIHDADPSIRPSKALPAFSEVTALAERLAEASEKSPIIVAGGSVTFPIYRNMDVECSPGTFVFWDWSYKHLLPEEPFDYAAVVLTRVVSVITSELITTDLGHKSLAPEGPMPRVHFLNAPGAVQVGHSEEHMTIKVPPGSVYQPGDLLYGVPMHVCPTVSMYEEVTTVVSNNVTGTWRVTARDKKISI